MTNSLVRKLKYNPKNMESKNINSNNYNNNQYTGMIQMEFCPYCTRLIQNHIFDQHLAAHIQEFNSHTNSQNNTERNRKQNSEGNYINCSEETYVYPSFSEIQAQNNPSIINTYRSSSIINNNSSENDDYFNHDTDENIKINTPNKIITFSHANTFSKNNNNLNSININSNIRAPHSNRSNREPQVTKINSNTYKIGNDEFEDLTDEANDIKNKQLEEEAYKKKILGIAEAPNEEIYAEKKDISIGERIGNFFEDHAESIMTVIDIVGCVLLNGPSIVRTYVRIENMITGHGNNDHLNENIEDDGGERNYISELESKEKDLDTILKFLPIYELKEKQKCNNSCVICLSEFEVGDKISTIPCFHVFHTKCIQEWLETNLTCPVCKFEIRLSTFIGNKYN